jgi:hypothetical protein
MATCKAQFLVLATTSRKHRVVLMPRPIEWREGTGYRASHHQIQKLKNAPKKKETLNWTTGVVVKKLARWC